MAMFSLQKDNQRLQEAVSGDHEHIASTSGSTTTGTSNPTPSGSVTNLVNTITGEAVAQLVVSRKKTKGNRSTTELTPRDQV